MNEKKSMLVMIIAAVVLVLCAGAVYYFNRPDNSIKGEHPQYSEDELATQAINASTSSAPAANNITNTNTADQTATDAAVKGVKIMETKELKIETIKTGKGEMAKVGDTVTVDYVGTLTDGTKFDSSIDRHQPFSFTLGAGQVIKGWDLGVVGMKIGEERKLTIPSDLAYGDAGVGPIPGKATLVFDVTLLKIGQ